MKKLTIFIVLFWICVAGGYSQKGISIRPYGRFGVTTLFPTLEELEYGAGGWSFEKKRGVVGAGSQFVFKKRALGFGIDLGYSTLFRTHIAPLTLLPPRYHKDIEENTYIVLFTEYNLGEYLFLQAGVGPHIIAYDWEYYVDGYLTNSNSDIEDNVGFMLAVGLNIPLHPNAGFFILGKVDAITRYGLTVPITLNFGGSFNF